MTNLDKIRKRLEKNNISQIDLILELIEDFVPEEKATDIASVILQYADKIYLKKYSDIFTIYPVSPHIREGIKNFFQIHHLDEAKYKKFVEWLIEFHTEKQLSIFSLYSDKFYTKYVESDCSEEVVQKKREINKKRISYVKI